jgi:hypothetical protein
VYLIRDIIVESGDVITVTIMPCEIFSEITRLVAVTYFTKMSEKNKDDIEKPLLFPGAWLSS